MGLERLQPAAQLRMFRTAEHACGYWPERVARDLVLDPRDPRLEQLYPLMLDLGFRRSGEFVYRPACAACHACRAVRIPVEGFVPDRSQRRCLARNAAVDVRICGAQRTDEQLALYQHYLAARHAGGGMDGHGAAEFDQFLAGRWPQARFLELRERVDGSASRLLGVAVTDVLETALSAVYTFFDPDLPQRGLGTLAILKQVEWARSSGRAHVYLGYWIAMHAKMDYKRRFRPLEAFDGRRWHPFET